MILRSFATRWCRLPVLFPLAGLSVAMTSPATARPAQEAFRITYERGRTVIDDPWRAIDPGRYAIDHDAGVLYVNDLEEPNGIMAFDLSTGERLQTYSVPQGEGPRELEGLGGVVLGRAGGMYVWSYPKALHFDARAAFVSEWRPRAPGVWTDLCVFGGEPAVPVRGGLIRRGRGGRDERIGPGSSEGADPQVETVEEAVALIENVVGARLACSEHSAFVLPGRAAGTDSVFVYSRSGLEGGLPVPSELTDPPTGHMQGRLDLLADDGRSNLVLLGMDHFGEVPGALMDPESQCYALVRNPRFQLYRQFVGIHADSALVFHWDHEEEIRNGERIVHVRDRANRVSLHPLESLGGGEPCPRILPSVPRTQAGRTGAG